MFSQKLIALVAAALPVLAAPSIPGFTLTWADDFNGPANSLPNSANWLIDVGTSYPGGPANWGTGEIQTYTNSPNNIKLTGDGVLQITPLKEASGRWTSARIETQRNNFQAQEGRKMRIQARIIMPQVGGQEAIGYWPAFWTLGGNYRGNYQNWPSVGEFDIMENVNGINSVWGVMHCGVNPGGPCRETDGLPNNRACPGTACQGNWHEYTLEVDRTVTPEVARWFVDGQLYHQVTENTIGASTWAQAVQHGHFVLLNLAIGGAFPNNQYKSATPIAATVPNRPMYVDYVAVYNS
ncbi:putative glycosyl hydrolases family 16 protein [Elsinoe australis]|uniref:Putative glycosyl hydrolases family 16 protein n=1 Tax=Elsinoe australis TaxID=40998 RepID=A0A4U7AV99_9PEZI|nr:putative glycosyl hydrolases family 16 protein [Elsinoe australis]